MARKELSQYPPDRWIREVNRRYPNLWIDLRKVYEDPGKMIRPNSGGIELLQSVPDWCIMPTFFPFLVMTDRYGELFYMTHMDELMTLGSTYIWRCSKGIYRFAPEIYQALISQPLTGDLPMECLHHLPEWAVYIETPGLSYERHPMEGFIAHLDYNLFSRSTDLQFAMFLEGREEPRMVALPLEREACLMPWKEWISWTICSQTIGIGSGMWGAGTSTKQPSHRCFSCCFICAVMSRICRRLNIQ